MMVNVTDTNIKFGNVITDIRVSRGFTQESLASKCNLRRASINMIERGHRLPSPETLRNICLALALSGIERDKLFAAFLGVDSSAVHLTTIEERAPQQAGCEIWVATDEIAELNLGVLGRTMLRATVTALNNGQGRTFFVPPSFDWRLLTAALDRCGVAIDTLRARLRIVASPEALCVLRVELDKPSGAQVEGWFPSPRGIDGEQVHMPMEQAGKLDHILSTELMWLITLAKPHNDYRLVFPREE